MKKILVLVVSLIGMAVFFSGCAKEGGPIESKSYTSEGENITSVSIDVRDKEIAVTPSYDELVHINYYENDTRYYNISISDGLLVLTEKSDGGIGEFFGIKSSNQENVISLQIPKSLITTLEISTTNENILLSDITITDSISLSNNRGNISFHNVASGGDITINNKNADITGSILGKYEDYNISCDIKKGDSSLSSNDNGAVKNLYVTNNNGNIDVDFK